MASLVYFILSQGTPNLNENIRELFYNNYYKIALYPLRKQWKVERKMVRPTRMVIFVNLYFQSFHKLLESRNLMMHFFTFKV